MSAPAPYDALAAVRDNWPIITALVSVVWFLSRLTSSVESLSRNVGEITSRMDKRLDGHSASLDDHETRLSRAEAHVEALRDGK